ncbi:hypothetical protein NUBL8594_11580 [Klebsiella pneumoniae]|nr:hypothetical protein NUBL8594_11580 [Klebsiella pneumoniae]HCI8125666.1 DUF551 domain-containing protein [Klebsiella pneumoniae]
MKFEEWLSQQDGVIEVDCGCVTTEAFYHWLRVAYEAGNSPVTPDGSAVTALTGIPMIPDGYVMVPKEPTEEMLQASYREAAVYSPTAYRAMLAAAPQLPGSEPATAPGKWIPVSERMPESNKFVLVSNGVWVGQGLYDDSEHLESDEHWQDEHREFINVLHHPVTHWMPLPAAPQEAINVLIPLVSRNEREVK